MSYVTTIKMPENIEGCHNGATHSFGFVPSSQEGGPCWRCVHCGAEVADTSATVEVPDPGPERDDWIDFLRWLASGEHYGRADCIVDVVEKPWHYADEYTRYRAYVEAEEA